MDARFLTVTQAAAALGISRPSVYRWCKEGRLRILKIGEGVARIPSEDVEALMAGAVPLYVDGLRADFKLTSEMREVILRVAAVVHRPGQELLAEAIEGLVEKYRLR